METKDSDQLVKRCLSCDAKKNLLIETIYPYPEDESLCDEPIPQLLTIEVQGNQGGYKMCVMCHECWHKLCISRGIDMWIGQACWGSLNPITPYQRLPEVQYNEKGHIEWRAERY